MTTAEMLIEAEPHVPAAEPPAAQPTGTAIVPAAPSALTPMAFIDRALANNAPIELLDKLFDLRAKVEAYEAKKAFNAALAKARGSFPVITKNRRAGFETKAAKAAKAAGRDSDERVSYAYEDLGQIAEQIDPVLAQHGLSWRHDYKVEIDRPILVTCIVFHEQGHEERVSLQGPRDDSGRKNQLQQMGSTLQYLKRYTLMAALGLASAKEDDDAASYDQPAEERLSPVEADKRIAAYKAQLAEAKTVEDLNAIGPEIQREPGIVQDGLREAWKKRRDEIVPAPKAEAPTNGNGKARMQAPPPPAEGMPNYKPGDAAWMKHVRSRFATVQDTDGLMAVWTEIVEPVAKNLPDIIYDELLEGYQARKVELTP